MKSENYSENIKVLARVEFDNGMEGNWDNGTTHGVNFLSKMSGKSEDKIRADIDNAKKHYWKEFFSGKTVKPLSFK